MARKVKEALDVPIVFGGPHSTFYPDIIKDNCVDVVCVGEGDHAIIELMDRMEEGKDITEIRNLWVKEDGIIHRNDLRPLIEDLDGLPFPDREIYYKYRFLRDSGIKRFLSGRGCPYSCTFCHNYVLRRMYRGKGRYVRKRSVENVVEEIKRVRRRYGFKVISFSDDIFIIPPDWLSEFCEKYEREVGAPFACNVRADLIDEETVKKLKSAGCLGVYLGVESGNEFIRNVVLKKNISDDQIRDAARLLRKYGIKLKTFNMVCHPGETLENAFETVRLNVEIKPDFSVASVAQLYPGLIYTDYAIKNGFLEGSYSVDDVDVGVRHSMLNVKNRREMENLRTFFTAAVKYPFLMPVIRVLIRLPENRLFHLMAKLVYGYQSMRFYRLGLKETLMYGLQSGYSY